MVAIADTPKVMTEGNWRLGMFVDEDASDEQMEKLGAVFGGQKGGPMEALVPLAKRMNAKPRAAYAESTAASILRGPAAIRWWQTR